MLLHTFDLLLVYL